MVRVLRRLIAFFDGRREVQAILYPRAFGLVKPDASMRASNTSSFLLRN